MPKPYNQLKKEAEARGWKDPNRRPATLIRLWSEGDRVYHPWFVPNDEVFTKERLALVHPQDLGELLPEQLPVDLHSRTS